MRAASQPYLCREGDVAEEADRTTVDNDGSIQWRPWGVDAFAEAREHDRPVLLTVTASWCADCRALDRRVLSDDAVRRLTREAVVPVRADGDRQPHVRDRYNAAGWPVVALLTSDGDVLWSGTPDSPRQLQSVIERVAAAWTQKREEIEREIEHRVTALRSNRQRRTATGLVRREAADDVMTALQQSFDGRNGGFGEAPKMLPPEAVELLYAQAERLPNPEWAAIADTTLDGALAGELYDAAHGGFHRLARAADWTHPSTEKLLETNAWAVRALAVGAALRGNGRWLDAVESTIEWADRRLGRDDGLWGASEAAADADADVPSQNGTRPVDATVLTDACAQWCGALAEAGARLGRAEWVERAATAMDTLLRRMDAGEGLLFHYLPADDEPRLAGLLSDVCESARACLAIAQATGDPAWIERARELARAMERHFWADDGGFEDIAEPVERVGALRHGDRSFEQNAVAAGVLVDLDALAEDRTWRALAERCLAMLAPVAGRYGIAAAGFAFAAEHFFDPPTRLVVVGGGPAAFDLRARALALPLADRQVWTLPEGGAVGGRRLRAVDEPAVYVCGQRRVSPPIRELEALQEAVSPTG